MGRRPGRSGAGGMKQLGAVHSDRDDFRPSNRSGGMGGRGSVTDRTGKFKDRQAAHNMSYQRQIPKFLQKYSHLLGAEKPKAVTATEHERAVEEAYLASKDRADEAPTIVNKDEFAGDKRFSKQYQALVGGKQNSAENEQSSKVKSSGGNKVNDALARLKALGMKVPTKSSDSEQPNSSKRSESRKRKTTENAQSSSKSGMGSLLSKISELEASIERCVSDEQVEKANKLMHKKNKLHSEVRKLRAEQSKKQKSHPKRSKKSKKKRSLTSVRSNNLLSFEVQDGE